MPGSDAPKEPAQMPQKRSEGAFFRHFKGNHYQLLHIAVHSETLERYAVYRALYGEGAVWVRPLSLFEGQVEREGVKMRRFTPVAPEALSRDALEWLEQESGRNGGSALCKK
jgi:hypothetical protein